jgi:hypothetical protein
MKSKWLKFPAKMRTLLSDLRTGQYLRGPHQWTSDPAEALDFEMIDRAVKFVDLLRLQNVELAFAFEDNGKITRVPIDKLGCHYSE